MKHIKRFLTLSLILIFLTSNTSLVLASSTEAANLLYLSEMSSDEPMSWPESPDIFAEAAILMEAETGTILYNKNMNDTMYPASVTKLITALLTVENCSLEDMVYFSDNAVFSIPRNSSHIAMNPGEYLSVENCLYGLMLASANEVANALAEHISGSIDEFVVLMNTRAKELGAINTNFANANGLHDDNHYTTCYDIATICRTLIKNNVFLNINGTPSYMIPPTNLQPLQRPVNTTHKLIRKDTRYSGCFGGKTGYTDIAGNTLVTFAERNGMTLICVVMKSDVDHVYSDTTSLLDYGFSSFNKVEIAAEETAFDFLENDAAVLSARLFDNPNPSISIAEGNYVYIPANITFTDLSYEIIPQSTDDCLARVIYTYNGHYVGDTYLNIIENEPTTTAPSTPPIEETPEEDDKKVIYIRPVHIVIAVIFVIVLILCIVYLNMTRSTRLRNKAIRRRKRLQRKRDIYN